MHAIDFFPEDEHEPVTTAIEEAVTTGRTVIEADLLTTTGERIPHEFIGVRLTDTNDELIGIAGIGRDISARKERERDLERANELLSPLFETLPVGVTVLDTDGKIVRANQRAEEVLGLTRSEIIDRTYNDPDWRIVDQDGEPVPDEKLPFAQVMETGDPVLNSEHGIRWPDGTERWLSISAAPLDTGTDDSERVVAAISDITDQYEYEQTIDRQNERLDEFASVVSHDLRNPLNVAEGRLELAGEECDSEHLAAVGDAHDRMLALAG